MADDSKVDAPREPPDADARFLLTDLLEALRSKSTGLCRLCGCVSADMSHYPDSPCGRVEALLPRLDQQMKPLRPDGCKARNTFRQACYGRDGHTAHCVFGGSVDVPPVLLPRLDAAPQSHLAFSDLVTRATEYVNKIIIESDGYPMAHSAADMRTVLVNAFLAGADERRPRLDAAPQELDKMRTLYAEMHVQRDDFHHRVLAADARIRDLEQQNRTFEVMLPPLHAKIAELKRLAQVLGQQLAEKEQT